MQYTIRNIPHAIDVALRRRAKAEGKSLNEIAIEALMRGAGVEVAVPRRDLSGIAGTWKEDPQFDRAVADLHVVDPELWK